MRISSLLSIVALLTAVLLGGAAAGADPTPGDPAAADQSLDSQFGKGAEEVTAQLNDLERSLLDVAVVEALEAEVASASRRTAEHWNETSRQLARNLRTTALDSLTTYWDALHSGLDDVESRISARVRRRDTELAALQAMHESWTHALQVARDAQAPAAVVDRVQGTIDAIDLVRPRIAQRRAQLLVMQNAVSRAFQHCADALARIADARGEALGRMLVPQEPPLWRAAADGAGDAWSGAAFESGLAVKLDRVRVYVDSYRGRLSLSLLGTVLLVPLLCWASRRLAAFVPEGTPGAPSVTFRTPVASAILAGLLVTLPLRPAPPYEFQQGILMTLLAASVCVFRPIVSTRMRRCLYGACALFALNLLVQIFEPVPRIEQLLLVLEMSVVLALLVWARRQAPSSSVEPFMGTAMRTLAGAIALGCGLAALAAACGYLDLADLLGIGLLMALLLSVGLLAVRVAINDLIAIALSYGPVARLRTVARHRTVVERALRTLLDLCILGIWAWLLLGRFQLRDPLLEATSALLGTILRAGGLAMPVGQILAFVAVLAVVVFGTRGVVVVLEEDVFSRMTLPRGVPYALSTLTRYTMLLVGFLLALGALGLDLTRITVLVSALGLGLGFGLQQIMNNFVSGLILLFERPVQVGDSIQLESLTGSVLRIGIRSSTVRTAQGAEVIVPNSKLIEEKVTNWTLSDRRRRCDLDVSVAGEDDVARVMATIEEVARSHASVCSAPPPEALLVRLGRSANHFQLRFWTEDPSWMRVWSDISVELYRSLHAVRTADPAAAPAVKKSPL